MKHCIWAALIAVSLTGCSTTGVQTSLLRETPVVEPIQPKTQGHYTTGNLALRRGDLDQAIRSYREALVQSPSMYEARYN